MTNQVCCLVTVCVENMVCSVRSSSCGAAFRMCPFLESSLFMVQTLPSWPPLIWFMCAVLLVPALGEMLLQLLNSILPLPIDVQSFHHRCHPCRRQVVVPTWKVPPPCSDKADFLPRCCLMRLRRSDSPTPPRSRHSPPPRAYRPPKDHARIMRSRVFATRVIRYLDWAYASYVGVLLLTDHRDLHRYTAVVDLTPIIGSHITSSSPPETQLINDARYSSCTVRPRTHWEPRATLQRTRSQEHPRKVCVMSWPTSDVAHCVKHIGS